MSVINRMLRDLDQRERRQAAATDTAAAVAPRASGWPRIAIIAGVGLVVVVAALVLRSNYTHPAPSTPALPQVQTTASEPIPPAVEQSTLVTVAESVQQPQQPSVSQSFQPIPIPVPTPPRVSAPPQPQVDEPAQPSQPEPSTQPTQPTQPTVGQSSMRVERVELSADQLAAVNLRRAREALVRGEREVAQQLLEQALILEPLNVAIRSELAAYWYGRGLVSRALMLLQQGLDAKPDEGAWQLLYAKILDRIGQLEQAHVALTNIRMDTPEALELLELRAKAAHQLGWYAEAGNDYRMLAQRLNQGRWWLAAAIAYDDANNWEAAFAAYQQAQQQHDLNTDAQRYISERIAALTPRIKEAH